MKRVSESSSNLPLQNCTVESLQTEHVLLSLSAETPEYSKLEADVCYNQRLECLESLTRWQELVDESLEQVSASTLQRAGKFTNLNGANPS